MQGGVRCSRDLRLSTRAGWDGGAAAPYYVMEMLTYLTHKFQAQSLEETESFQQTQLDDRDSGTESADENTELQTFVDTVEQQDCFTSSVFYMTSSSSSSPSSSSSSSISSSPPSSPSSSVSPISRHYHHHRSAHTSQMTPSSQRLCLRCRPGITEQTTFSRYIRRRRRRLMAYSSADDDDSSAEELSLISTHQHPEKRKWADANASHRCGSTGDSEDTISSDDDEVCALFNSPATTPLPLTFGSTPPRGARRLVAFSAPPRLFVSPSGTAAVAMCNVSPRKRHCHSDDVSHMTDVQQRPSLDFEKMQGIRVI